MYEGKTNEELFALLRAAYQDELKANTGIGQTDRTLGKSREDARLIQQELMRRLDEGNTNTQKLKQLLQLAKQIDPDRIPEKG